MTRRADNDDRLADPAAVARERRARAQRERARRRTEAAPARREPDSAPRASGGPVAVRERHEGLVGWIARTTTALPRAIGRTIGGVAREVVAVVGGIFRPIAKVTPGAARIDDARRVLVERAREATAASTRAMGAPATPARPGRLAGASRARARRAADRRRHLSRRRVRIGLAVLLLGSVFAAWMVVPASEAFRIRHVEVTGASSVGDLEVRRRVDELLGDATVFTVDEDAVRRRIEELPFVRSAEVERHLPGGLELRIVEYRPLALGTADGRHYWLIARDGRILAKADKDEWTDRVPVVRLMGGDPRPGDRIDSEPALQLLSSRASDSTLAIASVDVEDGRIIATLDDDVEVRFGRANALRAKVLVAEILLRRSARKQQDLVYVDVTVSGRGAVCPDANTACHQARRPAAGSAAATTGDGRAVIDGEATTPEELDARATAAVEP